MLSHLLYDLMGTGLQWQWGGIHEITPPQLSIQRVWLHLMRVQETGS